MALDVTLLRTSFTMVTERSPALMRRFYEILFQRYPDTESMFPRSAEGLVRQQNMLTNALASVLTHLEDGAWLQETLFAMGGRHVKYGVRDEMYGWVGECLLAALEEGAAPDWSPLLEAQWTEAFGVIASIMLAGAAAARSAGTQPREKRAAVV